MGSIQQSIQHGQLFSRLAQNVSNLLVAAHAKKRIERLLVYVIVTTLAFDQTPTLQPVEPAYDGGAGHEHIGSNLGHRERLALKGRTPRGAADEESFQACAEALPCW